MDSTRSSSSGAREVVFQLWEILYRIYLVMEWRMASLKKKIKKEDE